ncbi:putative ER lumen protein-retaining receptor C28H8.4 [Senna tora]|uniref:Putative ER lumen protein-retaining receptor C28H8.4 n=1 Tax=Senna tora TaxID=362788 RepID=A0A834TRZ6_9FABA|nr:putative ER lumen protein-retaining receptor C28H8.4 [Senna tora]
MGRRRGSSYVSVLFGWVRDQSVKVKIFLGVLIAIFALVGLKLTIRDHNYFFVLSEAVHLAGILVLFYKLVTQKTCSGLSLKTQELTALFLGVRLICSTVMENDIHTVLDLISLLSTLLVIYRIRFKLKSTYIKDLDNLKLSFVVVPSAILAIVVHPFIAHFRLIRILWAFCVYLEAISVLPQLRFMQNAKMIETFTGHYVFALGVSRFLALAHWLIQMYESGGKYFFLVGSGYFWFLAAFLSEMVQSFILADFCYYYVKSLVQGQLLRKMPV